MSSDNLLKLLDIAIAVLGLIAGLLIGGGVSYDIGYRKGQTDALRGHQKYEAIITYRYERKSTVCQDSDSVTMLFELTPFDTLFIKK